MPLKKRIIPKLDIKGDNLVKGVNLEGLRVLGKPEVFAKKYYEDGADELFYQDVVASLYGRNTIDDQINKTAKHIFIPLTVGGGIRNTKDIERILTLGADKISINSMALKNPNFIKRASEIFGSSTIVITIEAKFIDGNYYAYTENGRNNSSIKVINWIQEVQNLGAGEINLIFIDYEGMGKGLDYEFLNKIKNYIKVPFLVNGGIGSKKHIEKIFLEHISGVVISSLFHYNLIKNLKFHQNDFNIGNLDYLLDSSNNDIFDHINIKKLKSYLIKKGIEVNY